jgi:hypothetical protein
MLAFFLFLIYFIVGCYFICKSKFVANAGLGCKTILVLFTIKIVAGIIVGLVNHYLYNNINTDADLFNKIGIDEHNTLLNNPTIFFSDIFTFAYPTYGEYFGTENSYWNNLGINILVKILGIMNIFSRGEFYINSLFFNFIAFIGHIALFRVFNAIYPKKVFLLIVGCFLLPSLLYYSSSIQKDLIVFTALGIFCYSIYFSLLHHFSTKKLIYLVLSFSAILLVRNFIAVILLPCAIAWIISSKYKINPLKLYVSLFMIAFIGISILHLSSPKYTPLQIVVDRQQSFLQLGKANSDYKNDSLQPTLKSFITSAPTALRRSFLSPLPGEFNNIFLHLLGVEILVYMLLFLLMLCFHINKINFYNEFIVFGLVFTFLIFLFIGFVITNAGSLVRYRSIYFPFLIVPILCNIDWQRIKLLVKPSN